MLCFTTFLIFFFLGSHLSFWYTLQEWHLALAKFPERSFCINIDSITIHYLSMCDLNKSHSQRLLPGFGYGTQTHAWWVACLGSQSHLQWLLLGSLPSFSRSVIEQPQHLWGQKKNRRIWQSSTMSHSLISYWSRRQTLSLVWLSRG